MKGGGSEDTSIFERLSPGWAVLVLLVAAVPLAVALLTISGSLVPLPVDGYLEAQRRALKPEFRSDLDNLGPVPQYRLEANVDPETGAYTGRIQIDFTNQEATCMNEVMLRVYANAPTIYGGDLEVQRVSLDDREAQFIRFSPTALRVPLSPCLEPQAGLNLTVAFEGRIPAARNRAYGIHGATPLGLSFTGWYPMLAFPPGGTEPSPPPAVGDALVAGISLVEAAVEMPEGYRLITTGIVVADGVEGSRTVISGPARELAIVAWDGASPVSQSVDGVQIRYYPASENEMPLSAERALELAGQIFQDYQAQFGPYPYTELDIVEWPVSIGGYEFSGLVFLDDALRASAEADLEFLLAHELAHQWWYGIVGNDQVNEPWLDEGLANYSVVRYLDRRSDGQAGQALLQDWRQRYGPRNDQDPIVNTPAAEFGSWDPYRRTVYIHGALFLAELEEVVGERRFGEFIRAYAAQHRYGNATSRDFLDMAQEMSGTDLRPLLTHWFGPELTR